MLIWRLKLALSYSGLVSRLRNRNNEKLCEYLPMLQNSNRQTLLFLSCKPAQNRENLLNAAVGKLHSIPCTMRIMSSDLAPVFFPVSFSRSVETCWQNSPNVLKSWGLRAGIFYRDDEPFLGFLYLFLLFYGNKIYGAWGMD